VVCVLLALMPFAAWSWRIGGSSTFSAAGAATGHHPGEISYPGWERWGKTWCLDFVSTSEIFWNIPGNTLEMDKCRAVPSIPRPASRNCQAGGGLQPE